MNKQRIFIALVAVLTSLGFTWSKPVMGALPPGNALKDPYAILRNALPIEQKDLREIQHKLEDTSDLVRGNRWPAVNKAASSAQFQLNKNKQQILKRLHSMKKLELFMIRLKESET